MSTQSKNTFFGGAAILAVGIAVVKLIGMFYKIPLVNIIGDAGYADFSNAYYIYSVLLTISTAGLPVALSKMVSEANTLGRRDQVHPRRRLLRCRAAFKRALPIKMPRPPPAERQTRCFPARCSRIATPHIDTRISLCF